MNGLLPIPKSATIDQVLDGVFGKHELYGFLLYSKFHEDLAAFVREHGYWLHNLSGERCLVCVVEELGDWSDEWRKSWKKKGVIKNWASFKPHSEDFVYNILEDLSIPKNALPCIIFQESKLDEASLCIPIVCKNKDYVEFFEDVFTAVQKASSSMPGERIAELRRAWRRLKRRWVWPDRLQSMEQWGSLIVRSISPFLELPIAAIVSPFKDMLSKPNPSTG